MQHFPMCKSNKEARAGKKNRTTYFMKLFNAHNIFQYITVIKK